MARSCRRLKRAMLLSFIALAVTETLFHRFTSRQQRGVTGFVAPPQRQMAGASSTKSRLSTNSRRFVVQGLLTATLLAEPTNNALAAQTKPVTKDDLQRLSSGYKDLVYMMDNWNTVTRDCRFVGERRQEALQSGVLSPNKCKANPDEVRKYFGMRALDEKLFNTKQLFIDIEAQDLVAKKDGDRYSDAVEDFETHKRQASEWAYTSSWGDANPGGGRDKVEDYLLRSKAEAALATKSLGIIIDVLNLS
eukprot:CAMPEP_0172714912 /NCGR_PEP_ID=MMETSP1074-20121228/67244_1 /TAXON_ID=2916 /ORGANISM="Ceratium fusus, Strain PA161109" /LENGTH=248 /DNA_ID=CAMNT_0013539439 /DNA_START=89 /DNA_END=835 /DNA_ORIENTATION=-